MQHNAIRIEPNDNVVTVSTPVATGALVVWDGGYVTARADIAFGHKVAVEPIDAGSEVRKYGHPIGRAARGLAAGDLVHSDQLQQKEG